MDTNKPLTLQIEEFKKSIADLINNAQLHPYILDSVVKDIYQEVHALYLHQVAEEQSEYQNKIEKDKEAVKK